MTNIKNIQKSENPQIQKFKTFHIYGILQHIVDFWIFRFLVLCSPSSLPDNRYGEMGKTGEFPRVVGGENIYIYIHIYIGIHMLDR